MSARSKRFHVGDLLSVVSGVLVSPRRIEGVYDLVDWVTGQEHWSDQLSEASKRVTPWLLRQHPWLTKVTYDFVIPDRASTSKSDAIVMAWLAGVAARHGEMHNVRQMPGADRRRT